jgi:hypothetical protein
VIHGDAEKPALAPIIGCVARQMSALPIDDRDAANQGGFPNIRTVNVRDETRPYPALSTQHSALSTRHS